jgi:DNA invertase Pin-like site-specific DNA recombinase
MASRFAADHGQYRQVDAAHKLVSARVFTFRVARSTAAQSAKKSIPKLAVSYQRVSTAKQTDADKTGIARQERALAQWLADHPDYELAETKQVAESGRKSGRLNWFINGGYPAGTVLVVEDVDRFSRLSVTEGVQTLFQLWDRGFALAVCGEGFGDGRIIEDLDQDGERLIAELKRAKRESDRRKERSEGAIAERRELIRKHADGVTATFGPFAFKPRSESNTNPAYPRWLDVDESGRWELIPEEVEWIRKAFRLAKTMGVRRIARELQADGVTTARTESVITEEGVTRLLKNIAVLGHRQLKKGNRLFGEPITGVYPAIITSAEWEAVQKAQAKRRNSPQGVNGRKRHNLFEKRTFCGICGHMLGIRQNRTHLAFECRGKTLGRSDCKAPNLKYDEQALLGLIRDFRWADYFGGTHLDSETESAREAVLRAQNEHVVIARGVDQLRANYDAALAGGEFSPMAINRLEQLLNEREPELKTAERLLLEAESKLADLKRRPTGREAEREVRRRIKAFMAGDRSNLQARDEFNAWLAETGLAFQINTATGETYFGRAGVSRDGLLTTFVDIESLLEELDGEPNDPSIRKDIDELGPRGSWEKHFPDIPYVGDWPNRAVMQVVDEKGEPNGREFVFKNLPNKRKRF